MFNLLIFVQKFEKASPQDILGVKNMQNSRRFWTNSNFDR